MFLQRIGYTWKRVEINDLRIKLILVIKQAETGLLSISDRSLSLAFKFNKVDLI